MSPPNRDIRPSLSPRAVAVMSVIRPIDRWFIDEVLPHEARYRAAARRLEADADAAEDLLQDAYARLLGTAGWQGIANPRRYVLRMLRNMAIERMRRAKIIAFHRIADLEDFDAEDDAPDAFRIAAGKQLAARLKEALQAMPERCRTVLLRRRFDQQPPREIARELGISLSTMEKRLARAIVLLTQALEPGSPADAASVPAGRNGRHSDRAGDPPIGNALRR